MTPPINARIIEINDGPYFNVKLHAVPRIGELILLNSYTDQLQGRDWFHRYEVVLVKHDISDIPEGRPQYQDGSHTVTVFVKQSDSPDIDV